MNQSVFSVDAAMEQMISLGKVDSSDTLGTTFHNAALGGNKRAAKKVLDKGNLIFWGSLNVYERLYVYMNTVDALISNCYTIVTNIMLSIKDQYLYIINL